MPPDALRIIEFEHLRGRDIVRFWIEAEERALTDGYNGLRIASNVGVVAPGDWPRFLQHEHAATTHFNSRRIVTLCNYSKAQGDPRRLAEMRHAHHCALERHDADWRVFAAPCISGLPGPGTEAIPPAS
jgi:hypothetical protein